ncbi:MAG: DUF2723 domain-containing protein [Verrucomicrobiota bacterium]
MSAGNSFPFHPRNLITAGSLVGLAAFLYFLTAARDIVVGDTPELITAAVTLGVPHPPGYPLFTMLGHLFSLLPVGPIPFRVNLLAVTCDALAVGIVFLTALRLSGSRLAAASAALLLAVSPIFWSWSLVAEVFSLNNLLASLLIYLLVTWHEHPERAGPLIAAFFVAGLGLTNQHTIILLAPAFCFVLWEGRAALRGRPRILLIGLVAFFAGLLPYAYVLWAAARHPAYSWGDVSSLQDLLALITRQSYGMHRLVSTPEAKGGSPLARILALCVSFGPVAGPLAILGLFYAYRCARWYFWFGLLAFFCAGPFFAFIANINLAAAASALSVLERFFILSQVIVAPLVAFGVLMIVELIASRWPSLQAAALRVVAAVILIAVAMTVLRNYRSIDQSHNHIARSFAEDVFATVKPGTILLASGDTAVLPLTYLRTVEGFGKKVTLILLPLLPADWYLRQIKERNPDLVVPFEHYDGQVNSLKTLFAANKGRNTAIIGGVRGNDHSLESDYRPYQHGLITLITPRSETITVEEMVRDNEKLLSSYKLPVPGDIKSKSLEPEILYLYALPAFRIGGNYEKAGMKIDARAWYRRALSLNPESQEIRQALARVDS